MRGSVLDLAPYLNNRTMFLGEWVDEVILSHIGGDATRALTGNAQFSEVSQCLIDSEYEYAMLQH